MGGIQTSGLLQQIGSRSECGSTHDNACVGRPSSSEVGHMPEAQVDDRKGFYEDESVVEGGKEGSECEHLLSVPVHDNQLERPASPTAADIAVCTEGRPTRGGRKRRILDLSGLSECLCGTGAIEGEAGLITCGASGCETKRVSDMARSGEDVLTLHQYHLDCVGLERATKAWVCDACKAAKRRK